MLAFLQYLLALLIASHEVGVPGLPTDVPDLPAICVVLAEFAVAVTALGLLHARRLPRDGTRALRRHVAVLGAGRVAALGAFWLIAQPFGGRELPAAAGISDWVLLPHVLRLAPFFVLLLLLRAGLHPAARRIGIEAPALAGALRAELGQAALPLGPLLPILTVWDVVALAEPGTWLGAARSVLASSHLVQALLSIGLFLGALLFLPFAARIVTRSAPLPDGPLRRRLDAYAARVGLRARDVLVWRTGRGVLNAAVVGAFPRFRYVFVTDGLLETLGDDEVEAVFAHEAGHAVRGHVLLFFGFTALTVFVSQLPEFLGTPLPGPLGDPLLRTLAVLVVWVGVVFGWISRRFEQEADVFGLDTLPAPPRADGSAPDPAEHPFARALERIADEAGGIRELNGWRHFSIADRVAFVRDYLGSADVRRRARRSIRLLRGSLLAALAIAALLALRGVPDAYARAAAAWRVERDDAATMLAALHDATQPLPAPVAPEQAALLLEARARGFAVAAERARRLGLHDEEARWLREAAALAPHDAAVLAAYARALESVGRPLGAARAWRDLLALPDAPEALRDVARTAAARLERAAR